MATLEVVISPNASRTKVLGEFDGAWKVALAAPPVDGKANKALVAFFAKWLGVPKKSVRIVRGETSRRKVLAIDGLGEADILARLRAAT